MSKRRLYFIITFVLLATWVVAYFVDSVLFSWKILGWIINNSDTVDTNWVEWWVNLLNKWEQKQDIINTDTTANGGVSLVSKTTIENGIKPDSKVVVKNETASVIIFNQLNMSDKPYVDYLNTYVGNLKAQSLTDYTFYLLEEKWSSLWSSCSTKFWIWKRDSFNVFQTIKNLDFIQAIRVFKKMSKTDPTAKLFIIGDAVSTDCNSDENIKWLRSEVGSSNSNIYIIWTNYDEGSQNFEIRMAFFKKLAIDIGVQYIKAKSPAEFSTLINTKLYPLEAWKWNLLNATINTELLFFDENGVSTAATTIVYQKKWSIFIKYGEFVNDGSLQLSLLPGIYYFESLDTLKWISVKTEPKTINDTLKFKESVYFRKTKLNVNVFNENDEPVIWSMKISDANNGWFIIKEVKETSAFVYDLLPGHYSLEVKTKDKFVFMDDIVVTGQKTIDKKYVTRKWKLSITVKNESWSIKDNVFVKVFNWYKDNVFSGNGWKQSIVIGWGTYTIDVEDSSSGNKISKTVTLSEKNPTTDVEIMFTSMNITLDIWNDPKMLRFYYDKDYATLPLNENEKKKLALKSISWSQKMRMDLMPWTYVIEIFNFKDEKTWMKRITVDDMSWTEYSLTDS